MQQPRHDIYTAIHKALRMRVFETANQLEQCDFSDPAERSAVLQHVRETIAYFEEHAGHEDRFVIPRLREANESLAERLEGAHQRLNQSASNVLRLAEALQAADTEVALERGSELCHAMNVYASQHLEHMNEEETLANAALWQVHGDEQLQQLTGTIQATIAPERMAQWMALMLPALNVHERIGIMGAMKANAPPEVFESMMHLGRQAVGPRWQAVQAALG